MDVDSFLASFPPDTRRLVHAGRKLVRALVPDAVESVRVGWELIGFSAPRYFAFLAPKPDEVRLGFEHGVLLDDQTGLLKGTGSQVRWVQLKRPSDLKRDGVAPLIVEAAEIARRQPSRRSAARR